MFILDLLEISLHTTQVVISLFAGSSGRRHISPPHVASNVADAASSALFPPGYTVILLSQLHRCQNNKMR